MSQVVEMNLLSNQELDYFYWYWDYVCSTHNYACDRLRENRMQVDAELYREAVLVAETAKKAALAAAAAAAKGGNNKKKSKDSKEAAAAAAAAAGGGASVPIPKELPPTLTEMLMRGRGNLSRGLFRVSVIAVQLSLIDKTENRFMSWSTKFDTRFKAFQGVVNPPVLAYSDYLNTLVRGSSSAGGDLAELDITKLKIDVNTILSGATVCFQNARKYFDEVRRLPLLAKGDAEVQNEALLLTKVRTRKCVLIVVTYVVRLLWRILWLC